MKAFADKKGKGQASENGTPENGGIPDWVRDPASDIYEARTVFLTPTIAKMWLARNTDNRRMRRNLARSMADGMQDGHWAENGESLSFDRDGVLVDGQHRLQAIINSGHGYMATVTLGVEPTARTTVNVGLKRSSADVLNMRGEPYAKSLAATLQIWSQYSSGALARAVLMARGRLNHQQVLDTLNSNPTIRESVARVCRQPRGLLPHSDTSFVHYAIVRSGESIDRADQFISSLTDGRDLASGNPILAVRHRIIQDSRPGARLAKRNTIALVLKGYQMWRDGRQRKYLKFNNDEPFPMLPIRPVGPVAGGPVQW